MNIGVLARSLAIFALTTSFLPSAHAGNATWDQSPTSGDWNTAAHWTPATVPNGFADTATFSVSNTTNVSIAAPPEGGASGGSPSKILGGTLILIGANTRSGETFVNGRTLLVNNATGWTWASVPCSGTVSNSDSDFASGLSAAELHIKILGTSPPHRNAGASKTNDFDSDQRMRSRPPLFSMYNMEAV
jgi:hypothetical protein